MTLKDELKTIPTEFVVTLKALADETRLGLILLLLKNGEMSFSELEKESGLKKNTLTHHLKTLTQSALIENNYKKKEDTNDFSFYIATAHAQDCFDGLIGIFQPKRSATATLIQLIERNLQYDKSIGVSSDTTNVRLFESPTFHNREDKACTPISL